MKSSITRILSNIKLGNSYVRFLIISFVILYIAIIANNVILYNDVLTSNSTLSNTSSSAILVFLNMVMICMYGAIGFSSFKAYPKFGLAVKNLLVLFAVLLSGLYLFDIITFVFLNDYYVLVGKELNLNSFSVLVFSFIARIFALSLGFGVATFIVFVLNKIFKKESK